MLSPNQTPEQAARERIDAMLSHAGWVVQDKKKIDFSVGLRNSQELQECLRISKTT